MAKHPHLAKTPLVEALPHACYDEKAARDLVEWQRWGAIPYCPHCGDTSVYRMKGPTAERRGLLRCHGCKKQFTVRVGTIFEDSKFPLSLWCRAFWESSTCKNGISALELSRKLQITYKSALFMLNRIRHAMTDDPNDAPKLTGTVEADETYVGGRPRIRSRKMGPNPSYPKTPVFAAVSRGGEVRARVMPNITGDNLRAALLDNIDTTADLITDDHLMYRKVGKPFASHETVKHSVYEYVRASNPNVHTNTIEGFFSRLKRKLNGTHHAVSPKHLHRYVGEAAFIYNTRGLSDGDRVARLIHDTGGKRLVYKQPA